MFCLMAFIFARIPGTPIMLAHSNTTFPYRLHFPALLGLPPPLDLFFSAFSAPPSVSPLGFETSGFAGDTSNGFPDPSPSPATFFSFCGSVVLGSKAASSCLADASSVPDFEYSVASVLMLSLSWLSFLGKLASGVRENGRMDWRDGLIDRGVARTHCLVVRRRREVGGIVWMCGKCFLLLEQLVTGIQN